MFMKRNNNKKKLHASYPPTPALEAGCGLCVYFCRELKEKIQPEILELIKQQRLNRLVEGTCFRKLNSRRRQGIVPRATPHPQGGPRAAARCPGGTGARCRFEGRPCAAVLGSSGALCTPKESRCPELSNPWS